VIGLVVGGLAVAMFADSLPGKDGSPEERAKKLEIDLQQAQTRIAALEAAEKTPKQEPDNVLARLVGGESPKGKQKASDAARRLAADLRAGKPANIEDIFRVSQPLMRDLSPLFDRMRVKELQRESDALAGRLAREYELPPEKEKLLADFLKGRAEQEARKWSDLIQRDDLRMEDMMRATDRLTNRNALEEGLDGFMPSILDIEKQERFKSERLNVRLQRVESEADAGTNRLDTIVKLDEAQKDQVFGILARTSPDYDPTMVIEGVQGSVGAPPKGDRKSAVLSVLTPRQRTLYDAEQQRIRAERLKDAEAVGFTMPEDWEPDFP
jgi:hypothetical protein